MTLRRICALFLAALGLATAACDRAERAASAEAGSAVSLAPAPQDAGIAWFDGTVEAALAAAATQRKPVFLYWGAAWCPYCADLRAHVFSRPDFIRKLALFVPVYLDGDEPGAQKWAERFRVAGYPTVLALGPDGEELARIAGGMEPSVYAETLDLVSGDVRPLGELLASLDSGTAELPDNDCRRLAYHGWGLDDAASSEPAATAARLERAARRCPAHARIERARLTAIAAFYAVEARAAPEPSEAILEHLVRRVAALAADRALVPAIADALLYLDEDYFRAARRLDSALAGRLRAEWPAAMDAAFAAAGHGDGDRLHALRSKIEAIKVLSPDGEIPPELIGETSRAIDETLERVQDSPARPGVVNAAINLLAALEDYERAYLIAGREMQGARAPYYYMADLAWLDERMGRNDSALVWLERAYQAAQGTATRFQWGTSYVRGLIRLRPEEPEAIRDAAIAVLGELEGPDKIYRRTRARLEALDASLREWSALRGYDQAIVAIRTKMREICAGIPPSEPDALESCRRFLTG